MQRKASGTRKSGPCRCAWRLEIRKQPCAAFVGEVKRSEVSFFIGFGLSRVGQQVLDFSLIARTKSLYQPPHNNYRMNILMLATYTYRHIPHKRASSRHLSILVLHSSQRPRARGSLLCSTGTSHALCNRRLCTIDRLGLCWSWLPRCRSSRSAIHRFGCGRFWFGGSSSGSLAR